MTAARPPRHAAGVRFEVVPPPPPLALPRMDVPVFVGFTASGPLQIPVAVDDPSHFESLFGSDATLAWDPVRGATMLAYLAPSVRSFFLNGGTRCWVIRVANQGHTNTFPVAGLLVRSDHGHIHRAKVHARSQGSWADDLTVASALQSRALEPANAPGSDAPPANPGATLPAWIDFIPSASDDVVIGDLIRVTFYDATGESRLAMFVAASLEALPTVGTLPAVVRIFPALRSDGTADITWFATSPPSLVMPATSDAASPVQPAVMLLSAVAGNYSLFAPIPFSSAPAPGTTMDLDFAAGKLWLTVTAVSEAEQGSPLQTGVVMTGNGLFLDPSDPFVPASPSAISIERLQLALETHEGPAPLATLGGLGFDPSHPRPLWGLPSDEELFRGSDDTTDTSARAAALRNLADVLQPLWSDATEPRFDLAVRGAPSITFFPVGMPYTPDYRSPPEVDAGTPLERDGLSSFDASIFLDPDLAGSSVTTLLSDAFFIQYQSSVPRRLMGIHAAFGIDEATLIAAPDATLPGWTPSPAPTPAPGATAAPIVPGGDGSFVACGLQALALPSLQTPILPDAQGTFQVAWDPVAGATSYGVEESPDPQFSRAVVTYTTTGTQIVVYGHTPGYFYLRARATAGSLDSGWSAAVGVSIAPGAGWTANADPTNPSPALQTVQSALLRLCAARGDLFALLPLPTSQTAPDAARYVSALCAGETSATLTYGAAYHPWVVVRDVSTGPLRTMPPDGVIAGVFARRTLSRGAWIAVANEPLAASVLGLSPRASDDAWAVLDEQPVNRIREEARGLMTMSSDTLTSDPDYTAINVRRLLILVRRTALSLGTTYVFEPNDDRLARSVQGTFGAMLDGLFRQGALVGATAAQAYRVVTDATVNPPSSMSQGRFIVQLQLAPSRPLSFLTVRLVQTGDQLTVSEGSS